MALACISCAASVLDLLPRVRLHLRCKMLTDCGKSCMRSIRRNEVALDVGCECKSNVSYSIPNHAIFQSHAANPIDLFMHGLRSEGPKFLFKGWTPAFIRLGPNTVLLFVFFEVSDSFWISRRIAKCH